MSAVSSTSTSRATTAALRELRDGRGHAAWDFLAAMLRAARRTGEVR